MEIKEVQKISDEVINQIDKKLGVIHDDNTTIIHLIEEFGEIARQINNKNIRKVEQSQENLEEEIADVLILLARLANNHSIDLEKAFNNKIEKLKQRHNL